MLNQMLLECLLSCYQNAFSYHQNLFSANRMYFLAIRMHFLAIRKHFLAIRKHFLAIRKHFLAIRIYSLTIGVLLACALGNRSPPQNLCFLLVNFSTKFINYTQCFVYKTDMKSIMFFSSFN